MNLLNVTDMISFFEGSFVEKDSQEISRLVEKLSVLPEEAFRSVCMNRSLYGSGVPLPEKTGILHFFSGFRRTANAAVREKLAIGIAAFARCPADLEDTELFPGQIRAAIALTSPCILQMNTGEGKTYALLPAAFAHVCMYGKVYIVCASDYLAYRDAKRTAPYWKYVGVNVQYAAGDIGHTSPEWGGEVIYTTLSTLIFKALKDNLGGCPLEQRLCYHAVILDEVDAILLDRPTNHSVVKPVQAEAYDWGHAITFAKTLDPVRDVVMEPSDLNATLTIEGEDRLRKCLEEWQIPPAALNQVRMAVEYACAALHAQENQDYIMQDGRLCSINRVTGEIEWNTSPHWMIPLAIIKGLPPKNHSVGLHSVSPAVFIRQFGIVSGMSGTARDGATEYMLFYQMPTIIISPRRRRWKGELPDAVFYFQDAAIEFLCEEIMDAVQAGRPVLVGTQSISTARRLYDALLLYMDEDGPDMPLPRLITGQNDEQIAAIYEHAGEPGSVVIATQVAGRGIDIRLSGRARENGGLVLLGFERSLSSRHDKQFLGRAGRQGDPFTAQFAITWEGQLLRENGNSQWVYAVHDTLNLDDSINMESKMMTSIIADLQMTARKREIYRQSAAHFLLNTEISVYCGIRKWLQCLNAEGVYQLTETFTGELCRHFIEINLSKNIKRSMNCQRAGELLEILLHLLPNVDAGDLRKMVLEGKSEAAAARIIQDKLVRQLMAREAAHEARVHSILTVVQGTDKNAISKFREQAARIHTAVSAARPGELPADRTLAGLISGVAWIREKRIPTAPELEQVHALLDYLEENTAPVWNPAQRSRVLNILSRLWQERFWVPLHNTAVRQYRKLAPRNGYGIGYWTIIGAEMRYRDYYRQISHICQTQESNRFTCNRMIMESATEEWAKIEDTLSTEIINNLLADRLQLDHLFVYQDNAVSDDTPKKNAVSPQNLNDAVSADGQRGAGRPRDWNKTLAAEFISQVNPGEFGLSFNAQGLEALLQDFLQLCPFSTLQSSRKIERALEQWRRQEILREITPERARLNHKWIMKFLRHLHRRGMIAPLPTLRHRLHSVAGKLFRDLKDFKALLACVNVAVFCGLFAVSCLFLRGPAMPIRPFTGLFLVDALLFAGLMAKGTATAPLIPLAHGTVNMNARIRFGLMAVLLFLYLNILNPAQGIPALLARIPICAALAVLYHLLCSLYAQLSLSTAIPLFSAWSVFSVSAAFLPALWACGMPCVMALAAAMLCELVLHRHISTQRISLLSTQIVNSVVTLESVQHRIQRRVSGSMGLTPHIYAFAGSFLLHTCLKSFSASYLRISYYAAGFFYFVILFLLGKEGIWHRCAPDTWRERLHENRLMIMDTSGTEAVEMRPEPLLARLRRRFLIREILFQLAVLLLCALALPGYRTETGYPMFLIVLFVSQWFSRHLAQCASYIYQLFTCAGQVVEKTIDFEQIREPEDDKTFLQRLRDFLNPFTSCKKAVSTILALLGVLAAVNQQFHFMDGGILEQIINIFI